MKISVVIPAYNEERLIGTCLESIIQALLHAQLDRDDVEIIVVDNASTDRTAQIAERFEGVRVVHEPRKGITRAKQAGFAAARGEFVAHPDADTIMPKDWFVKALREFERDPSLVTLTGPYIYYDLPSYTRLFVYVWFAMGLAAHFVIRDVLRTGAMVQGGNYIVRREALERAGGYDTNIEFYGEDFDLARRISKHGKVKWTWQFPMHSSGRRLAAEGALMTGLRYGLNNMASTFLKRPVTHTYVDVRPDHGDGKEALKKVHPRKLL